ncbi:hypothetical protein HAHI6034_02570 [Hathewaya histolytica]|uniref:Uncharacterized protein n=1 Tax=Hathewaya histolytica TaxID=1498 RepID=A0A4U9RHH5_HATHI|nr:hypothetical protein [Hathewaya histolytica]VTQ90668.1 Uncharacterised protein [Hathewaya histolytica]
MKKIYTRIFLIFSIVVMGIYVVNIKGQASKDPKISKLAGDISVLGNKKIKVISSSSILRGKELLLSKNDEKVRNVKIDFMNVNSERILKDRSFYRGNVDNSGNKTYEDDKVKIFIDSKFQYVSSTGKRFETIKVSYRNKGEDLLKRFKFDIPINNGYLQVLDFKPEGNNIRLAYIVRGEMNKLIITTIDPIKESIKEDKSILLEDIVNEKSDYSVSGYIYNNKLYISTSISKEGKDETYIMSILDLKDYSIKKHNYKPKSEKIIHSKTELGNVHIDNTKINNKIYYTKNQGYNIYLWNFNMDNNKFEEGREITLDTKIIEKLKSEKEKTDMYIRLIEVDGNKAYFIISKCSNDGVTILSKYINIVDTETNKSLYLGEISASQDNSIEVLK